MAEEAVGGDGQNTAAAVSTENGPTDAPAGEAADFSIVANTSEISVNATREEVYKFGFNLTDLYKISLEYYKKVKGGLTLSYQDKLKLVAYWKQISSGKYDDSKVPEVGYFDVIGNDRRKAWSALGDMAPDVAKQNFCDLLEKNAPDYTSFVEERHQQIVAEIERKRKEEEDERKRLEEEERKKKEEEERLRREKEEAEARERERLAQEAEKLRIEEEERAKAEAEAAAAAAAAEAAALAEAEAAAAEAVASEAVVEEEEAVSKEEVQKPSDTTDAPKLVNPMANGTAGGNKIAPASLWTRPKLQEFINHVKRDANSVLVVGRGETVTIRVPTHEHGSCLFWEFATETYDVGFGVYFEWSNMKTRGISIKVDESDFDDTMEEVDSQNEQKVIHEDENNEEVVRPDNEEVLPVLRRNSHEEVIVGSHMYPGQGVYLLKFDNSYSLLRSKTLYYRVYYTR